jgi:omega-6 fatty acid desaturase (delta-12 desaturase)
MDVSLRTKSKDFEKSNLTHSILELLATILGYLFSIWLLYIAFTNHLWILYGLSCIIGSFFMVKIFALLHDCSHGSMFTSHTANTWIGRFLSLFITMPFTAWKVEHEEHHSHVVDMEKMHHGDIPLLTVEQYNNASPLAQLGYRIFRQPSFLLIVAPFLYFFIKARFPTISDKRAIRSVLLTNVVVALIYIPLLLHFGLLIMLFVFVPAAYIGGIIGLTLFYLQHNYPEVEWFTTEKWGHEQASLAGASLIILPQPLEWFSHAIGYHHIHHLNSKIPGYRLAECYEAVAEFKAVQPLSWRDVINAFKLRLWSYERNRMVTIEEGVLLQN